MEKISFEVLLNAIENIAESSIRKNQETLLKIREENGNETISKFAI